MVQGSAFKGSKVGRSELLIFFTLKPFGEATCRELFRMEITLRL